MEHASLKLRYRRADGTEKIYTVVSWREEGHYLVGLDGEAGSHRTFRKDRVVAYLEGCERLLVDPYPPSPAIRSMGRRTRGGVPKSAGLGFGKRSWADDVGGQGETPELQVMKAMTASGSPQISFTGFAKALRAELEAKAVASGLAVVQTVTKGLAYLCGGSNAGPAKLQAARLKRVYVLTESQFHALLETGELPDEEAAA